MSSAVETKFKSNPPPNFKITVKKSPEAVRQVIENYSGDIEEKETKSENEYTEKSVVMKKPIKNTMGDEEGFRIIKKEPENEFATSTSDELKTKSENQSNEESTEEVEFRERKVVEPKLNQESNFKSPNRFRKREINIPTQGLLEEMPILKEHPDKEFEFFINRILMAIRSVSNTRTAAYFFYNEHKNEIILNSFATESKTVINRKSKFIAGNDIVSQIARSMKPEILTDINPAAELDLLPYYNSNSGTNSFIGIPVIYDKNVIGVLTADSKHSDAYDAIMVNFLSHFAKLISGLIRS
ncbi:MAG: GAF domain-containing protein, partial [Candidatus Kapaibacterium sp.]